MIFFSTSSSVWRVTCFYKSQHAPCISVLIYNVCQSHEGQTFQLGRGNSEQASSLQEGASTQRTQTYIHTKVKSLSVCTLRVGLEGIIYSLTLGLSGRYSCTGDPRPQWPRSSA